MGCTMTTQNGLAMHHEESSATRIFKVTNVDNNGEDRNPGYIEITTDSLVLHQRDKESVAWPLHGLRRYGFDADLFSFESGRRCPTGPGIYAFRCRHAEALFNLLQSSIVVAGQSNAAAQRTAGGLVESARRRSALRAATAVQPSNQLMFLQPVAVVRPLRPQMTLSQYRNVPVIGDTVRHPDHVERQSLAQLPDILAMYRHQPDPPVHYAELDLGRHVDDEESVDDDDVDVDVFVADEQLTDGNRTDNPQLYVNISADTRPTAARHGYANLDLMDDTAAATAATETDAADSLTKMNYIQLDLSTETLDEGCAVSTTSPATARTLSLTQQAEIARGTVNSYTTIDFDRTHALNTISVESLGIAEEGVRRTRHNSNIV